MYEDILESAESKETMTKEQVGFGVDDQGFWHFVIHEDKGIDSVLGFILRMQDVIKAHYIGKARKLAEAKQVSGLLRPDAISSVVKKVKQKFRN